MTENVDISPGKKRVLTKQELKMLAEAKTRKQVFDEDSPMLTCEQMEKLRESARNRNRKKA